MHHALHVLDASDGDMAVERGIREYSAPGPGSVSRARGRPLMSMKYRCTF